MSFICLIPLLRSLDLGAQRFKTYFLKGWVFGTLLCAVYHRWFFELVVWADWYWLAIVWVSYSCYLGLFYGLSMGIYFVLRSKVVPIVLFPSCWILGEYARSLGPIGNPASALGYTQVDFPVFLQQASFFGVFGLSFLVCFLNILLYQIIVSKKRRIHRCIQYGILWCFILGIGSYQLVSKTSFMSQALPSAVIQGNHPQLSKQTSSQFERIKHDYVTLTNSLDKRTKLVFWPETLTPSLNLRDETFMTSLNEIVSSARYSLFFGTPQYVKGAYYNSLVGLFPDGHIQTYNKLKLMPFGEYWPFKSVLRRLGLGRLLPGADYSSGITGDLLVDGNLKVGGVVCLESIYPWFFDSLVQQGANLLYVSANNAWFFDSQAAEQHLSMSRCRAVEQNRYLVQAANTGISAIIDNRGRIVSRSSLLEREIVTGDIFLIGGSCFYTVFGRYLLGGIVVGVLLFGLKDLLFRFIRLLG